MKNFFTDKTNHHFLRLWWAQLISQFGDRVHQMALIGLVAERTAGASVSAVSLAKLLSFTIIPVFIVGPIAGVYVDRWDRRKTLFVCDILRGLLVLTIPFIFMNQYSMVPIYCVVFLSFCLSRFYVPAKMAIIPNLVPKENLLMANSLMTTTGMIAFVLGCALGGFMVDHLGARGGFIWDAVTFLVSGSLIISINRQMIRGLNRSNFMMTGREILRTQKSIFIEMKEGIQYLIHRREIRFVISTLFTLLAGAGAIYVVIIIFVQQSFQSVTKDLGILAVFLGIGLFLVSLIYGRWGKKFAWYKTIFFCLIWGGVTIILFTVAINRYPNVWIAAMLAVILGLILGPIFIASNTVVHLVSDEQMQGKVFTALEMVIHLAFLLTMLASSFLTKFIAPFWILISVGAVFSLLGVQGSLKYRRNPPLS